MRNFANILKFNLLLLLVFSPYLTEIIHHHDEHFVCNAKKSKHYHNENSKCNICEIVFTIISDIQNKISAQKPNESYYKSILFYTFKNDLVHLTSYYLRAPPITNS